MSDRTDALSDRTDYVAVNGSGELPVAEGENSIALGSNAVTTGDNAVAIGPDAVADRPNQVSIGSAASTYTVAGIASQASAAAQAGAPRLVTTDLGGNLGISALDIAVLQGLDGRTTSLEGRASALEGRVNALDAALHRGLRRADAGIAAALALGGTLLPPDSSFALSFNLATYRGQQGFSGAAVARVSDTVWLSGGVAGSTVKGSVGGRAGVTFGW